MTRTTGVFWIASSDQDIAKARAVLRALKPAGVLDELGFLVLLAAFSEQLYPAISTIMTRARYFLLVPAIFRYIESLPAGRRRNTTNLARKLQIELCQALIRTDAEQPGIIGKRTGGNVQRLPSTVYWSGLTALQIASRSKTESSYLAELAQHPTRHRYLDDDGVAHEGEGESLWDSQAPVDRILGDDGSFRAGLSLRLTRREATYLRRRFLEGKKMPDSSLLGHLLSMGPRETTYDAPWTVPGLPSAIVRVVEHAKCLSLLARGAQLQYEALLFEARRVPDTGTRTAFVEWWQEARQDLLQWDVDDFVRLPFVTDASMRGDILFLRSWRDAIFSERTAAAAYKSLETRTMLRSREQSVRGVKARFASRYHLEQWQPPAAYDPRQLYALSFRHGIGTQILSDIANGLAQGSRT
jgi:hypothetical protein